MKIEEIKTIVKLMSENDLTEFKIEAEEYNLCIKRGGNTVVAAAPIPAAVAPAPVAALPAAKVADPHLELQVLELADSHQPELV